MKTLLISLFTSIILLYGCTDIPSKTENYESMKGEVLAAHDQRRIATLNGDADTVDAMMTDDLTFTHPNAAVDTKEQFIGALRSKGLQYQSITDEDLNVRVQGTTGVVSGICRIIVDALGTTYDVRVQFSEVWVKKDDSWKMMLWHATEVVN